MKKLLCSLLAASMLATSLCGASLAEESNLIAQAQSDSNFNATGYPIVNEPVKKTIMIRKPANIGDPSEMATLNYIAKLMNVEIEWIVVGADGWAERINLMFASGDLPDIIMKGEIKNMARVVEDGQLVAIDDLVDTYSTGLKPLLEQYSGVDASARSADGKLYALPGFNTLNANLTSHRNLWINKTWLDNLNLAIPTTTDELLNVLRAFRDNDADGDGNPSNEIPYAVEDSAAQHTARPDVYPVCLVYTVTSVMIMFSW